MTSRTSSNRRAHGIANGYRSGLEESVALSLQRRGEDGDYEGKRSGEPPIQYTKPSSKHRYTRDFRLRNGIIVETKGRFLPADRQKHLLIREQRPDLDIRFVFSRSKAPIAKGSKTTCADWCDKHGFKYADKDVPCEWIKEPSSCPPL